MWLWRRGNCDVNFSVNSMSKNIFKLYFLGVKHNRIIVIDEYFSMWCEIWPSHQDSNAKLSLSLFCC